MNCRIADKIVAVAYVGLVLGLLSAGCDDGRQAQRGNLNNSSTFSGAPATESDNAGGGKAMDFGQDWDASASRREQGQDRSGGRSIHALGRADRGSEQDSRPVRAASEPFWTIVLGTFSSKGHEQAAQTMLSELPKISPDLTRARTHSTSRGSMVIYGRYSSADDPRAVQDLERIKSMQYREVPVLARAFLSRVTPSVAETASHPHALLSVRRTYPNVDPLYTLQVAAWGDFDSGTMTMDEIRRKAEEYVRTLRAQGHQAYFHHDPGMKLSIVTVGLFDRTAIDPELGDQSPELRMLRRQFPAHLVNGEELLEPIDKRRPDRGTRVQPPHLVLVPMP